MINKGYKTFQNDDETIKYVLQLKGLLEEDEKYELPPDFLMEMMELNEILMDVMIHPLKKWKQRSASWNKALYNQVQNIIENYNDDRTTDEAIAAGKGLLLQEKIP